MSLQLYSSSPFPQTLNYATSGKYTGSFRFDMFGDAISSVSAVNVTACTLGFSGLQPVVTFSFVSGVKGDSTGFTTPFILGKHATIADETSTVYYEVSVNNNYVHSNTFAAQITSNFTSIAQLCAEKESTSITNYTNAAFADGFVTVNGLDNVYTLSVTNSSFGDIPYLSTKTTAGTARPNTFIPTYGLSAVVVQSVSVSGNRPTITMAVSVNRPLPATLTYDGAVATDLLFNVSANNYALHSSSLAGSFFVYTSSYGVLSAGIIGTPQGGTTSTAAVNTFTALGDQRNPSAVEWIRNTVNPTTVSLVWATTGSLVSETDVVSAQLRRSVEVPIRNASTGDVIYTAPTTSSLYWLSAYTDNFNVTRHKNIVYGIYTIDNVGNTSLVATTTATPQFSEIWSTVAEHSREYVEGAW